jgi:hypothetical protein
MNMVSTTVLSQSAANTAAFAQTASAMFAMDAMLTRQSGHLKMPRPDAY